MYKRFIDTYLKIVILSCMLFTIYSVIAIFININLLIIEIMFIPVFLIFSYLVLIITSESYKWCTIKVKRTNNIQEVTETNPIANIINMDDENWDVFDEEEVGDLSDFEDI